MNNPQEEKTPLLRPEPFIVNGINVFDTRVLKKYDSHFFYGCSAGVRKIIEKKNIPREQYMFGTYSKKKGWILCSNQDKPPSKGVLLLKQEWVTSNIPLMNDGEAIDTEDAFEYQPTPPRLFLEEHEKFKDTDGNILDIETVGEKTPEGIYFNVADVSRFFKIPNLQIVIGRRCSIYSKGEDYKTFVHQRGKRQMYLSYQGLVKALYNSRVGKAEYFQSWATDTLFTVQMGTEESKEELVSELIGLPVESLRQVLSKSATSVPAIYALSIGKVGELRESMNIRDEIDGSSIVIKYGRTNDLRERIQAHTVDFGKLQGSHIELVSFVYVDPKYLVDAEGDVRTFFIGIEEQLSFESRREIFAVRRNHLPYVIKKYKDIGKIYSGNVTELIHEIEHLKDQYKYGQLEIANRELEIEKRDGIIVSKDFEIKAISATKEKQRCEFELYKLQNDLCG